MSRLNLIPAVYLLLINDKNQILLSKRQNTGYGDGNFSVPAGHLEENESFDEAIIRETKEEIGIEIKNIELIKILHRISEKRLDYFYKATSWDGKICNEEPNKCEILEWFDLNNLPEDMLGYVKDVILEMIA